MRLASSSESEVVDELLSPRNKAVLEQTIDVFATILRAPTDGFGGQVLTSYDIYMIMTQKALMEFAINVEV